jgi:Xaa-Pro aminopeptidase
MRAAVERVGGALVSCEDNPLDAAWPDQPPPPTEPALPHDMRYAGKSSADKRAELGRQLEETGLSAAVLTQPDSIAWLLNVRGADVPCTPLPLSFAILRTDSSVDWFIDERKLTPETRAQLGNEVAVRQPEALGAALEALTGTVRVDPASASAWVFDRLAAAGVKVDRGPDPCALPKACKNEGELAGTRAAHKRDAVAVTRFLCWLAHEAGTGKLTEIDAADRLFALRRSGALFQGPSFETISGAGPNGAIVHYRVTDKTNRRIEPGSLYLVDSGAQYLDGTTDVTRTVAVGEPTEDMRRHFTLVLKGHIALATARFPKGTSGSQLDVLARQFLWQAGRDFDHGTGHGVGSYLSVHEGPQRISKVPNSIALLPGMIVSNEPGYYKQGAYGIRIENLLVVQPDTAIPDPDRQMFSFETLTLAPIDRTLIDRKLMTEAEIAWLDAYHARVYETLTPQLDLITTAWLAEATAPIGPVSLDDVL